MEGPFGQLDSIVSKRTDDTPLVLVGMGAGIAPLLSLAAEYLTDRRIHLLWSVRRADDAYYSALLDEYERRSGGHLTVTTRVGRFHRDQLSTLLPEEEVTRGEFIVVGPNPAVLATQRMLRRIGVSRGRIHHERLTM
ncbi:hypothetical protein [Streptomyces cyaneus]|uniref:hypothetical protein n=1 Tax=Streptomyces cyaneus TaxID=1904 RepID=UPI0013E2E7C2|nr:hypothetical protein [Streptomyces cyaneus]